MEAIFFFLSEYFYEFLIVCFVILFILVMVIIIFIILGIHGTARSYQDKKAKIQASQPKAHYKDNEWLKMQYFDKGRSIQEIANYENVSIMQIEKAIRKLDLSKEKSLK